MSATHQANIYEDYYKSNKNYEFELIDPKITAAKKLLGSKILVVGCGTGRDVRNLIISNTVFGIDISPRAVRAARRYGIKARKADLEKKLRFKNGQFDLIVAKDILEHLDNPAILASEIYRLLRPDGYAVINVPNHFYYGMRIRMLFGRNIVWKSINHDHTRIFEEWNYMHKIFFTWKGFNKFLKVHNLKITKTFSDLGTLNHYNQPEMAYDFLMKTDNKLAANFLKGFWGLFNIIMPRSLRTFVVSLAPGFFCASFYVWCKRES